jgi:hypothetical protein
MLIVNCSQKESLVSRGTLYTYIYVCLSVYLKFCSCIYRICSDRTGGEYGYGTILQLIIQLIYFTVCSCIYRICSDRTGGEYEYGTILQLIIQLIFFKFCICIYIMISNLTCGKYKYRILHLKIQLIYF